MKRGALRRIYELDRMIRFGQLQSCKQAAQDLQVSKRTIERDLEELRYELGAELVYNRGRQFYEYKGKPITLPAQWLTEREIAILLIAERALRVYTGASFHAEIHPAFNKLLEPIRHDRKMMTKIRNLCKSVDFYRPVRTDLRNQFTVVLDAIMQRKRIFFKKQEMEPYALLNNREWYVIGYCKKSRKERAFLLSGIHNPKIVEHYFAIPKSFSVKRYYGKRPKT